MKRKPIPEIFGCDPCEEPLCLHKSVMDLIFREENRADILALYSYVRSLTKWYPNIKPTRQYTIKELHWGTIRYNDAFSALQRLHLLEKTPVRNPQGQIISWRLFIRQMAYFPPEVLGNTSGQTYKNNRTTPSTPSSQPEVLGRTSGESHKEKEKDKEKVVQKEKEKSIIIYNNNPKKERKEKQAKEKFIPLNNFLQMFSPVWRQNQQFLSTLKHFYKHRTLFHPKSPLTKLSTTQIVNKFKKYPIDIGIEALKRSISNNWIGVFPESVHLTNKHHIQTGSLNHIGEYRFCDVELTDEDDD